MAEKKTYWRHEMRGGYGWVEFVPCRVLEETPKRIKIAALRKDGGENVRWIHRTSLVVKDG